MTNANRKESLKELKRIESRKKRFQERKAKRARIKELVALGYTSKEALEQIRDVKRKKKQDKYISEKVKEEKILRDNQYRYRALVTLQVDSAPFSADAFTDGVQEEYVKKYEYVAGTWFKHYRTYSSAYFPTKEEAIRSLDSMISSKIERVKKSGAHAEIVEPIVFFSLSASGKEYTSNSVKRAKRTTLAQVRNRRESRKRSKKTLYGRLRKKEEKKKYRKTKRGKEVRKEERKRYKRRLKERIGTRTYNRLKKGKS